MRQEAPGTNPNRAEMQVTGGVGSVRVEAVR